MHRRDFLLRCGLTASGLLAATAAGPGQLLLTPSRATAGTLATDPAQLLTKHDRAVLGLVNRYTPTVRLHGGGLAARYLGLTPAAAGAAGGATLGILARVDDYDRLVTFLRSGALDRFKPVRADGNRLVFHFKKMTYTVDNLGGDEFTAAVLAAQANRGGALASDSLLLDPTTGLLNDPGKMLKRREIRLGQRPADTPAGLRAVLAGQLDAVRYGLPLGSDFRAYADALLNAAPGSEAEAFAVADGFLQSLATLAGALPRTDLETLVRRPLLAASLGARLERPDADFATDFGTLRASLPEDSANPNPAVWLAALLAPALRDGTAPGLLRDPARDDLWTATQTALPPAVAIAGSL